MHAPAILKVCNRVSRNRYTKRPIFREQEDSGGRTAISVLEHIQVVAKEVEGPPLLYWPLFQPPGTAGVKDNAVHQACRTDVDSLRWWGSKYKRILNRVDL